MRKARVNLIFNEHNGRYGVLKWDGSYHVVWEYGYLRELIMDAQDKKIHFFYADGKVTSFDTGNPRGLH